MNKFLISSLLTLFVFTAIIIGCSGVGNNNKGNDVPYRPNYISPEELKSLLDSKSDIVVVDVRSKISYDTGHISGAISIPSPELETRYQELPLDKTVILY